MILTENSPAVNNAEQPALKQHERFFGAYPLKNRRAIGGQVQRLERE